VGKVFPSKNPYNFKRMDEINAHCSNCNMDFIPEIGFYWGATYVSYALTVAFSVATFIVSVLFFGVLKSLSFEYVTINAVLMILLVPVFYRLSRMLWLWMFS
jgi:hypothetical protein